MHCNICSKSVSAFHVFPKKALFNKPLAEPVPDAVGDMHLGYCSECRHISSSLDSRVDRHAVEQKIYTELYSSFTATTDSPNQQRYTDFCTQWLLGHLDRPSRVLEIGSHDGYFLNQFRLKGHDVSGVEPSPFADISVQKYPIPVRKEFFRADAFQPESFDLVIARHVTEHVGAPLDFLRDVAAVVKPGGLAYIEVPNSYGSLDQSYFPEFHVDHVSYFTLPSLETIIRKAGLNRILHIETINAYMKFPFMGALVQKTAKADAPLPSTWFMDYSIQGAIANFSKNFSLYLENIRSLREGKRLAVWGTGSCGTQFAIDAGWHGDDVLYVDQNAANQNKRLSVTGHRVQSPKALNAQNCSHVLIASGWEEDVKNQVRTALPFGPEVITFSDLLRRSAPALAGSAS